MGRRIWTLERQRTWNQACDLFATYSLCGNFLYHIFLTAFIILAKHYAMSSSVKFDIPQELAARLRPWEDQISRILELGLRELNAVSQPGFEGATEVLELLASLPTPEEIVALCPSKALQVRISELLEKNRRTGLTTDEQREWDQYQYLEHLVRIAKAKAYLKLKES